MSSQYLLAPDYYGPAKGSLRNPAMVNSAYSAPLRPGTPPKAKGTKERESTLPFSGDSVDDEGLDFSFEMPKEIMMDYSLIEVPEAKTRQVYGFGHTIEVTYSNLAAAEARAAEEEEPLAAEKAPLDLYPTEVVAQTPRMEAHNVRPLSHDMQDMLLALSRREAEASAPTTSFFSRIGACLVEPRILTSNQEEAVRNLSNVHISENEVYKKTTTLDQLRKQLQHLESVSFKTPRRLEALHDAKHPRHLRKLSSSAPKPQPSFNSCDTYPISGRHSLARTTPRGISVPVTLTPLAASPDPCAKRRLFSLLDRDSPLPRLISSPSSRSSIFTADPLPASPASDFDSEPLPHEPLKLPVITFPPSRLSYRESGLPEAPPEHYLGVESRKSSVESGDHVWQFEKQRLKTEAQEATAAMARRIVNAMQPRQGGDAPTPRRQPVTLVLPDATTISEDEETGTIKEKTLVESLLVESQQAGLLASSHLLRKKLRGLEFAARSKHSTLWGIPTLHRYNSLARFLKGSDRHVSLVSSLVDQSDDGEALEASLRNAMPNNRWTEWVETPFVTASGNIADELEAPRVEERETNVPSQDLHLYQLYCAYQKCTIIIRPISSSVIDLYSGTAMLAAELCGPDGVPLPQPHMDLSEMLEHTTRVCYIKGKSINVSLKSSPYPPIDGLIPVNPALGKAYLNAINRERELEDLILNAAQKGGGGAITLLKKLKAQKAHAGSMIATFVREIHTALHRSDERCTKLLQEYNSRAIQTTDKETVSKDYIDILNNAQFLGTAKAKWRGHFIFYKEINGVVERLKEDGPPLFYILRGGYYYPFDEATSDILPRSINDTSGLKPVEVVTHRMFFVSPITKRIEEDPNDYLIGPDFDGLCYARNVHYVNQLTTEHMYEEESDTESGEELIAPSGDEMEESDGHGPGELRICVKQRRIDRNWTPYTASDHIKFAEIVATPQLHVGMGLVASCDIQHIKEMRELTEWKQNHGYECQNTVKSQPLTPGSYVAVTPTGVRLLSTFEELIGYYRWAWLDGTPLLLNPNWKVAILDGLPCPYGEDLPLPIIDDCGLHEFEQDLELSPVAGLTIESLKQGLLPMEARADILRAQLGVDASSTKGLLKARSIVTLSHQKMAENTFALITDRKELAHLFFNVRRWQLMPPMLHRNSEDGFLISNFSRERVARRMDLSGITLASSHMGSRNFDSDDSSSILEHSTAPLWEFKILSSHSERKKYTLDQDFEKYRKKRIEEELTKFSARSALFELLHPEDGPFLALLRLFLYPDRSTHQRNSIK